VSSADQVRLEAIRRGPEQPAETCVASAHRDDEAEKSRGRASPAVWQALALRGTAATPRKAGQSGKCGQHQRQRARFGNGNVGEHRHAALGARPETPFHRRRQVGVAVRLPAPGLDLATLAGGRGARLQRRPVPRANSRLRARQRSALRLRRLIRPGPRGFQTLSPRAGRGSGRRGRRPLTSAWGSEGRSPKEAVAGSLLAEATDQFARLRRSKTTSSASTRSGCGAPIRPRNAPTGSAGPIISTPSPIGNYVVVQTAPISRNPPPSST
jgi:hypothetical protein